MIDIAAGNKFVLEPAKIVDLVPGAQPVDFAILPNILASLSLKLNQGDEELAITVTAKKSVDSVEVYEATGKRSAGLQKMVLSTNTPDSIADGFLIRCALQ